MTFEEYRHDGLARYASFVEAIRTILTAAIDGHKLQLHAITGRAKDPKSLRKKLIDNGIDLTSPIEDQIKDLAGARVVFLTNGQITAFNSAGIIHENFEVINVNVHHPVPGTATETQLFDSTNYLVQLRPERLVLPEYKRFVGLRAEVQVQTLLNHAWAEMGHDTIYKQPVLHHVGQNRFDTIKARMDKVMRDHLLPAGHDFDKIARDFAQLLKADDTFEATNETLAHSMDNNALDDAIGHLDDLILPQMDTRAAQFVELVPMLVDAVTRTRGSEATPVNTVFGDYPGKAGIDIARRVGQLFGNNLFCDPSLFLATLLHLYETATHAEERKIWLGLGDEFSKHDLTIWRSHGPTVPHQILAKVTKLAMTQRLAARGLLIEMLGNILSTELEGTTSNSMSIQIHQGAVPVSDVLRQLRVEAIGVLEGMLDAVDDDASRREILAALYIAGTTPNHGVSDELIRMIMDDSARVVAIQRSRAEYWGLELRRWCEINALRMFNSLRALLLHIQGIAAQEASQLAILSDILALRDLLNADPDFVLYKALIGLDSVRPTAWDEHPFDNDATNAWRSQIYDATVDQITDATIDEWIARIRSYIAEPQSTGGTLSPLCECIRLLGEKKPKTAKRLLDVMDEALSPLIIALCLGIDASGELSIAKTATWDWVGQSRFLAKIGEYLRWQSAFDVNLCVAVTERVIASRDPVTAVILINTATSRYDKYPDQSLIDEVFMPIVDYLTIADKPNWAVGAWGVHHSDLVASLDEAQSQRVLQSLVKLPDIEFQTDSLLATIATRYPALIFTFFETRLAHERGKNEIRFAPIPFRLHELAGQLARVPGMVLAVAKRWYTAAPELHEFRGGRMVSNVFPALSPDIVEPLGELIGTGTRDDFSFILATLQAYDGDPQIYPLCMDIVDRLEDSDELLSRVSTVLGKTGVVTGEFGFVSKQAAQRELLERWRDDRRPKVCAYARAQIRQIEQSMAWEQRITELRIEQRKRDWGEA